MLLRHKLGKVISASLEKLGKGNVIDSSVKLGEGTKLGSMCVIEMGVQIGRNCVIGPNVVIQNAIIGDNVILHPGTCIGQDGFGFELIAEENIAAGYRKKLQNKKVIIESNVEIGANCTIDRGSWRDTRISYGTKLDNLVQIGHNVVVGRHCLIAAQTGIAGSTIIGDFCMIGGQVGIAQHLRIGSNVQIAAKSGVMSDLEENGKYGGTPAMPLMQFKRQLLLLKNLARKGKGLY